VTITFTGVAEGTSFVDVAIPTWAWLALIGSVAALVLVDVLVVHRNARVITIREAAIESAVWISIGLSFGALVTVWKGGSAGSEYFAGFLIEKSLSIDNVFVWSAVLSYFRIPPALQFRVLFWGIFGALALRGGFIFAGVSLITRFSWILYVFGSFLLYSAVKVALDDGTAAVDYDRNVAIRIIRRIIPTTTEFDGQRLFTERNAKRLATPLFTVLVLIEASDIVFAVDSVPAILAVSRVPFIVFSSNAFAILGLRSLYFLFGGMKERFRYLNVGLGAVLAFVGIKMIVVGEPFEVHIPTNVSLGVIAVLLAAAIGASAA
jgi:tellurite resistance protein TerC